MKYVCDCGRVFSDPDGPIMCADSHHGQPLKAAESAPSASTNTGSPKLPPFGEFEAWCRNNSIHVSVCKPIYEWFGRQLRAGA